MNKIHSAIGMLGVFGALALASGSPMAINNPGRYSLSSSGTTSQDVEAFDGSGDVVEYVAALSPGGLNITDSIPGFKINTGHTYFSQVTTFNCSLTGSQSGLPYKTTPGNQVASGNQVHACELFFVGDASTSSTGFVQIN
jgi:hypothetical protein